MTISQREQSRLRKDFWDAKAANKTYEQWVEEQAQREIKVAAKRWDMVEQLLEVRQ